MPEILEDYYGGDKVMCVILLVSKKVAYSLFDYILIIIIWVPTFLLYSWIFWAAQKKLCD